MTTKAPQISTTDPRTGTRTDTGIAATTTREVADISAGAEVSFRTLGTSSRSWRAGLLEVIADALEADRESLVSIASAETGLGRDRLGGELTRSVFQFRLFASALRDGGYVEATIDHAGDTPMGPGPDVRRMLIPIGPVAVFGSSNFPFAFSVAGGDTASALAAGCSVVFKSHGSHPLTSKRSFDAITGAASAYGAPPGTTGIVFGTQAGATLVADPHIRAVGFTGSLSGGQALMDIVAERSEPIPFYGELSSLNALVITEGAAAARRDSIAGGLFASFTASSGQLCTKPGVAFIPDGASGDALVADLAARVAESGASALLNSRIFESFDQIACRLVDAGGAAVLAEGRAEGAGFEVAPRLLAIKATAMTPAVTEEAFGPLLVVARYSNQAELESALEQVPHSLTATIHSESDEVILTERLVRVLEPRSGRLVFNGYPTGVRVSWAQHHGGPWPATNSLHTSVGVTAIRRFLRPFAWQDAPEQLLPDELRDDYSGIPRRIDGVLTLAR
jgi:NADP-dependent aldehyde dehydrogenase